MIHLSPAAAKEISRLRSQSHLLDASCRVGFEPGGCSQWYYTLDFSQAAAIAEEDVVYVVHNIKLVVNTQHLGYLEGLVIDYSEDLMGGGFRFHNPNAAEHCGCGHSFSMGVVG
ncbi:HesB/IscA family protein [Almyronema epifaneia]|uniref:HesB/IscA family protein n=1 Tax=Almyronema epifaneia S1 TaxID=2991925 RepID=A0ABW6IFS7_9CYAN